MPLSKLTVAPGAPMTEALGRAIGELKAGDALAPVTVLVSDHSHDATLRRALARQGNGIAAVDFVTIAELAARIAASRLVGEAGQALKPIDGIALAGLAQQALLADPGSFDPRHDHPATSIAIARVIRELRDVSAGGLDALAKTGARSADLVRVHKAVVSAIGNEWSDDALAIELATAVIAKGEAQTGPLVHFLPTDLTGREEAFVDAAAETATVITLTAELPELAAEPTTGAHIITTADADDEVRAAVRAVADAIDAGTPAHRIAIIAAAAEPYNRLLAEQLSTAEIEFNGPTGRTIRELAPTRLLLALTELDRSHVWRSELFGILSSAPVVDADGNSIRTATWRNIAIDASTNGSLEHWVQRLTGVQFEHEWQAAVAEELAAFLTELDADLDALDSASTWTELIDQYSALLGRYLGKKQLGREGSVALSELYRTLGSFKAFDSMGFAPDRARLNDLLEIETGSRQLSQGKSGIGVRILGLSQVPGLDANFVIVCGCVEGLLPHRPPVEPLLHPEERAMLSGLDERVRTSADVTTRQDEAFRHAVAAAPQILLTLPRGDLRKTASRQPSRWVLEIAAHLIEHEKDKTFGPKQLFAHAGDAAARVRNIGSFVSGLAQLATPATQQEYRMRAAEATEPQRSDDELLRRNAELVLARRSSKFTRFDGDLTGSDDILEDPFWLSASALESYLSCPHRFFMERVLKVKRDGLDEEGEFTAKDRGSFIHEVLAAHLGHGQDLDTAFEQTAAEYFDAGLTGNSVEWALEREALHQLCREMVDRERAWMAERGITVAAVEERFIVQFGDRLVLNGFIDRVDVGANGAIHITDYKGKRGDSFKGITAEDPHAGNRKVQLTLYALAAPAIEINGADGSLPVETRYTFYDEGSTADDLTLTLSETQLEDARELIGWAIDAARGGIFPAYVDPELKTNYCPYCAAEGRGADHVRREVTAKLGSQPFRTWLGLATWAREAEEAE